MGLFDKVKDGGTAAFNGFAKSGTALNRGINKAIGKDVFGDIQTIEKPREFADYSTFPQYDKEAPVDWGLKQGEERVFTISDSTVKVPKDLDVCIQYRQDFAEVAHYYTEQFKYKYSMCVSDFDTFNHYFKDMYTEGLRPMIIRAQSLLLPFGVFDVDLESFFAVHSQTFNRAIKSYSIMSGIESSINQRAQNIGDAVGGSVRVQGGGFGVKGAAKGMAQAGLINLGIGMVGKYVANQSKMTPEQKAAAYNAFKTDLFFEEVYSDCYNTLKTLIMILSEKGIISGVKVVPDDAAKTMITNLKNPMFPKDRIPEAISTLISTYPFDEQCYALAEELCGSEVTEIKNYFIGA